MILEQNRRFAEAEPILRRALVVWAKQAGGVPDAATESAGRYAVCLENLGKSRAETHARLQSIRRGEPVGEL